MNSTFEHKAWDSRETERVSILPKATAGLWVSLTGGNMFRVDRGVDYADGYSTVELLIVAAV